MFLQPLPQVIILYGPPAAGKGTQAQFLKKLLPDYYHLDFGTELRKFVAQHLGDYHLAEESVNSDSSVELIAIARSLKFCLKNNLPAKSEDLRFVVEKAFVDNIQEGRGMLVEGPGRLVEEAEWLAGFFDEKEVSVVIFHLHLDLEEVTKRSRSRYYIPSSKKSFISFEAAKDQAQAGEEPYQRPEDLNIEGITQRYRLLYSEKYAKIISIYQLKAKSLVLTVDASEPIEEVSQDLLVYLDKFFGFKGDK